LPLRFQNSRRLLPPFTVNDWLSKQNKLSWQEKGFANKPKLAQLAQEIAWAQYYYY